MNTVASRDVFGPNALPAKTLPIELTDGGRRRERLAGKYELGARLGRGAMAEVYRAQDLRHARPVAIKVFTGSSASGIGAERFLLEIATTARLHHPHLLPVHDSGSDGGRLYYVMPLMEEGSLRDRLARQGRLEVREALRLVRNVVDALAYAHERGVVHRDIKPENVMLARGHAFVADFGVAKLMRGTSHKLSAAGTPLGTPAYMAPEQVSGSRFVDHRADLYAVGALLYELVTGVQVFPRANALDVMQAHLDDDPPEVTGYRCDIPRRVSRLIMKCLNKDLADRWQSAKDLLREIDGVLSRKIWSVQLPCRILRAAKVAKAAVIANVAVS